MAPNEKRRGFLKQALAVLCGAVAGLVPAAAGLAAFLDPLRRRRAEVAGFIRVASLNALPADGVPRKFTVIASHTDAWNHFPEAPIGAVYLRRTGQNSIQAFNVICPHAGCFVDYAAARGDYLCPCHNSSFNLDGQVKDPKSPSPRGLDPLAVEVREAGEVWVKFQNFRAGTAERTPV